MSDYTLEMFSGYMKPKPVCPLTGLRRTNCNHLAVLKRKLSKYSNTISRDGPDISARSYIQFVQTSGIQPDIWLDIFYLIG